MLFIIKNNPKRSLILTSIIFLIFIAYLIYQSLTGRYGYFSLKTQRDNFSKTSENFNETKAELLYYEHKLKGLHPSSVDIDLIDEEARRILSYSSKDEIVIFRDDVEEETGAN
jgi:cell division protein FtsB